MTHTAHHFSFSAMAALASGVVIAILTTRDPLWWHLHFSRLGTFDDLSAHVFNATAIISGFLLATYGVLVVTVLPAAMPRRASRAFRASLVSSGLHLSVVGLIPIPVSPELHDLAAAGLGLSLLAVVAWSLAIPGLSRPFRSASLACVILLAAGMIALSAGIITLACFEFVGFASVGVWLCALPRRLAAGTHHHAGDEVPAKEPVERMPLRRVPARARLVPASGESRSIPRASHPERRAPRRTVASPSFAAAVRAARRVHLTSRSTHPSTRRMPRPSAPAGRPFLSHRRRGHGPSPSGGVCATR
jgi:hypothetical protein